MTKFRCQECDHVCQESEILTAPNPFDVTLVIYGCPKCFEVGQIIGACDEPGCNAFSSCGWKSPNGYRMTCGRHAQWPK